MVSRLIRIFSRPKLPADCAEVRAVSSDFVDGELDEARTAKVKSHLEKCGLCMAFVNTLRATVNMLRDMPKREAPAGFSQRVRDSLKGDSGD